jgi:AcrR family transcriptional regulator
VIVASTDVGEHTDRTPRPTGIRAEAREQAILDAALELIREVGYDRLSMDALAERAHAGKATIYRRWTGKAQVVAEAIRRRKSAHEVDPDTGSLRGDLLGALGHMCTSLSLDEPIVAGVMSAMRTDPELAALMRTQVINADGKFDVIVQRAIGRGELPSGATADPINEVGPAVVMMRLVFRGQLLDDAFTAHLVDDILLPILQHPRNSP